MNTTAISSILGPRFDIVSEDLARALPYLNLPSNAAVLDVGTGSGNCAIYLATQGYRVLTGEPATDRSLYSGRDWVSAARQVGVLDKIKFQAFDASSIPFAAGEFEAVFFFGVLHHIDEAERRKVFQEALRVTKPGGSVVFFEPQSQMLHKVRADDPAHPPAADPSAYLTSEAVREQRVTGSWMDIFIYRQTGTQPSTCSLKGTWVD